MGMATSVRGAAVLAAAAAAAVVMVVAAAAKWYERVRTWIVVVGEWGHIGI